MSIISLHSLGWKPVFQQQLDLEQNYQPARVMQQHRSVLKVATAEQTIDLPVLASMPELTVGDWILLDENLGFVRCLERQSLLQRKKVGTQVARQLIGANVDYLFVLMSLNHDFNLNRLERYLAIASEAGCEPIVILTKADLCSCADDYTQQITQLDPMLMVEAMDVRDAEVKLRLCHWCKPGQTIAVVGSSGVGKSTLVNSLLAQKQQDTGTIRQDDSKGRHTTTSRVLLTMESGGLLLDTPGIRELQLVDCEQGLEQSFDDIQQLVQGCRFSDCQHETEPGCMIQQALTEGKLSQRRWANYLKLKREQQLNSLSLAENRAQQKAFSRKIRHVQNLSRAQKYSEE